MKGVTRCCDYSAWSPSLTNVFTALSFPHIESSSEVATECIAGAGTWCHRMPAKKASRRQGRRRRCDVPTRVCFGFCRRSGCRATNAPSLRPLLPLRRRHDRGRREHDTSMTSLGRNRGTKIEEGDGRQTGQRLAAETRLRSMGVRKRGGDIPARAGHRGSGRWERPQGCPF